ncbi:MAG: bifunctional diguanylate cyclase/phosphodiesterase [Acidimicrobiales bacterium]|jgi:diguanylate cyclase (GGDEF)-like protein
MVVVAYLATVILREANSYWTWLDGWVVCGIELIASGLCISRAFVKRPGRSTAAFLGLSLLAWTIGDVVLTVQSIGGATPPSPSVSDLFYIGFYPLAFVAVVQLIRGQTRQLTASSWLDGAIAGLGAAAVCSAVILHGSSGLDGAATLVNLALPIGDALLLGLIVGGFTILPDRSKAPLMLMAIGTALNVFGDSSNFLHGSFGSTRIGIDLNAIAWPTAIVLMSMVVWLRLKPSSPVILERPTSFGMPTCAAAAALALLLIGTFLPVDRFSVSLATATLFVVGIRLVISVRGLEKISQERQRQAITDELTGLRNRRYLFKVLDTFFAGHHENSDESLAFLFVDLDRFKEINDSFGHPAGDELLRQLGERLEGSLREDDLLVRLGGDEFAVVLSGGDIDYATSVAERLTDDLHRPFVLNSVNASIGASIGIAHAPTDATDSARLIWCADVAMYRAKLGKVPFARFIQTLDEGQDHMRLAEELRAAIDLDQLVLHYQPQLDLRTQNVQAVEALVRWLHPRLGLVPPDQFLPLAEEAGLMREITAWVLDTAVAQCAAWRSTGRSLSVAVNVSPSNLLETGFVEMVKDRLRHHSLPPAGLVLELTEANVISEFGTCQRVIEELRDSGIIVSIDDFGAGVTSLAYLRDLAVQELKLDRSFISRVADGRQHRDLDVVRSTIELGHALGLRIVAEGIEDEQTLNLLTEYGCDVAQGYCISRPKPADELAFRGQIPEESAPQRIPVE